MLGIPWERKGSARAVTQPHSGRPGAPGTATGTKGAVWPQFGRAQWELPGHRGSRPRSTASRNSEWGGRTPPRRAPPRHRPPTPNSPLAASGASPRGGAAPARWRPLTGGGRRRGPGDGAGSGSAPPLLSSVWLRGKWVLFVGGCEAVCLSHRAIKSGRDLSGHPVQPSTRHYHCNP